MTFQQKVDQFVSDAAYRVGELGHLMDELADNANRNYADYYEIRRQLSDFLAIIRHTTMPIANGTSFLDWDEYDVEREMQYLRGISGMNRMPIINFLNNAVPVLISQTVIGGGGNGGSSSLPPGNPGDSIFYNVQRQPYADSIDPFIGMGEDDINTYFAGRA